MEEELKGLCGSLNSVKGSMDKAFRKEESYTDKIKIMEAQSKEVEGQGCLKVAIRG